MSTASLTTSGGRAQCDFFRVDASSGTLFTVLSGLTGAGVATANADKAFSLTEIVSASPAYQDDGTVKITFDQHEDSEALNDFLAVVAVPAAASTGSMPAYKLENGTERNQASITNNSVVAIYYGANNGVKTKTHIAFGTISPTSGSTSSKADDWNKPTFEFTGSKTNVLLTIANGLFDATKVTQSTPVVISANTCFKRQFIQNAA